MTKDTSSSDLEVTVESGPGTLWTWLVVRAGKTQMSGVAASETGARSDAAEAIKSHRELAEADQVMGQILG